MMLGLMMVWISVPVQAQNVIEDEGIETVDEEDVPDSTVVDSWLRIRSRRNCLGPNR